jgi:hypothetical protein
MRPAVRLGGEVVDLVRLGFLHDPNDIGGVGHVAIVQVEGDVRLMRA